MSSVPIAPIDFKILRNTANNKNIPEGQKNYEVGTFDIIDCGDRGEGHELTLTKTNPRLDNSKFKIDGIKLILIEPAKYDVKRIYTIEVKARNLRSKGDS